MFICLECKDENVSLEKLQAHMNREHIDKLVKKTHECLSQCPKCYRHCKKRGLKVHESLYCTGNHNNPIADQESSNDDNSTETGIDPNTDEMFPISVPEFTPATLNSLLFKKHRTVRHLKPSMATSLCKIIIPLLETIDRANENKNETQVNEATCAFLLAPILTLKFTGPTALNREIDHLLQARDIAKATLELEYKIDAAISNGNHHAHSTPDTAGPVAATSAGSSTSTSSRAPSSTSNSNSSSSTNTNTSTSTSTMAPRRRSTRVQNQNHETATCTQQPDSSTRRAPAQHPPSHLHQPHQQQRQQSRAHGTRTSPPQSLTPFFAKKAIAHVKANQFSKAIDILESSLKDSTILKDSELSTEQAREFQDLHPVGEGFQFNPEQADDAIEITRADITNALKRSDKEIASAFSPWSNELIGKMWQFHPFKERLLILFNNMLKGKQLGNHLWNTSRSILLLKPNGKIRPIAIGDPLIRLLSRVVAQKFTIATKDIFVPLQYGLGVSSGTEIITHALQNYFDAPNPSNDQAILSLDIKNAYNSIKRSHIYDRVSVFTPSFLHFYNWRYGSQTPLITSNGTHLGYCSEGVLQGDPWATGLFISGLHTIAQEVQTAFQPESLLFICADDSNQVTKASLVDETIAFMTPRLKNIGLTINAAKSIAIIHPDSSPCITSIPTTTEGAIILGIPIGTPAYRINHLTSKLESITDIIDTISRMPVEYAYPLYQTCVNTRPIHLTRSLPPSISIDFCREFDKRMDRAIALISNTPTTTLKPHSKLIRSFPTTLGGLGIRSMVLSCKDSYLASATYCLTFLRNQYPNFWKQYPLSNGELIDLFNENPLTALDTTHSYDTIDDIIPQLEVDEHVKGSTISSRTLYHKRMTDLFTEFLHDPSIPNAFKAWTLSSSGHGCSSFLYAAIQKSPQLRLSSQQYFEAFRLRLGLPIIDQDEIATQVCTCDGTELEKENEEYHGLSCRCTAEQRMARHDHVQKLLIQLIRTITPECSIIQFARVQREDELNAGAPQQPKRLSDFRLEYPNGRVYWIDVAIVNPSAPCYLAKDSATKENVASSIEEAEKQRRYSMFLPDDQVDRFIPFVVEATGNIGKKGTEFIEDICKMRSAVFASAEENERIMNKRSYTTRAICAAIMKGNASMLKMYRNQTTLRNDIPPGTVYHAPSSPSQLPQGQPSAIRSPSISAMSSQDRLNRTMAHNFLCALPPPSPSPSSSIPLLPSSSSLSPSPSPLLPSPSSPSLAPAPSIVPSWTLPGHREEDQRRLDAQDLRRLPDGSIVPRLRAGHPHSRFLGFLPPDNQLEQYRHFLRKHGVVTDQWNEWTCEFFQCAEIEGYHIPQRAQLIQSHDDFGDDIEICFLFFLILDDLSIQSCDPTLFPTENMHRGIATPVAQFFTTQRDDELADLGIITGDDEFFIDIFGEIETPQGPRTLTYLCRFDSDSDTTLPRHQINREILTKQQEDELIRQHSGPIHSPDNHIY